LDYQEFAEAHHLTIDIEDRVAIVRLNRPEKRNAINFALHEGLEKLWRPLGTDPDVAAQGAAFDVEIPDGPAETGVIVVDMLQIGAEGMVFDPAIVKIKVGATVRWTNNRRSASSSTSDPGQADSWDSGSFSKGTFDKEAASFEYTFNIPGCFTYVSNFSGDTATGAVCVVE